MVPLSEPLSLRRTMLLVIMMSDPHEKKKTIGSAGRQCQLANMNGLG